MGRKSKTTNTKLIHSGEINDQYGSLVTPIYQTSTFKFPTAEEGAARFLGDSEGYIYTRLANPTIDTLEKKLADLEQGDGCIAVASGMAAVTTTYAALLSQGDHIISSRSVYGSSRGSMEQIFSRFGIMATYVDTSVQENIEAAARPETRLIYLESPSNPNLVVSDIEQISSFAHQHNLLVAVDNTFCSPYIQQPLVLGADIVIHSLTKFISGHADVIGGCIVSANANLDQKLRKAMIYMGCTMDPHQAFLVERGVKTLGLRMERAQENALKISRFLSDHDAVAWVTYPGLENFPQKQLVERQMSGHGAMISFGLHGGYEAGKKLMDEVRLIKLAVSLGGVESLIQHPASMSHVVLSAQARAEAGINDDLIRLSVGVEDTEDLLTDLDSALTNIH